MAIFYNQATLTYNGGVANSNIVSGEIVEVVTAAKTATPSAYRAGETITYVISLFNGGTTAVSGLTVTDDLGAYTRGEETLVPLDYVDGSLRFFVNGALQASPAVTISSGSLVISGIDIPAGSNAILVYRAIVNGFAPLAVDSEITNTATVTGGGIINPVTVSETVTSEDSALLSINKAVSPSTVTENGRLTYTFVIENSGNTEAVATDSIVVRDVFDPVLSALVVTFDGETWTENTEYTYNAATGEFETVAGQITVPAATYTTDASGAVIVTPGSVTLTVSGTV